MAQDRITERHNWLTVVCATWDLAEGANAKM